MARRGENIRKRKDSRWEGRYIKARTSEGKIQWGYVYGTVYAEVKRVLIQKKAEAGFYNLKRIDLTFEALAEVWLHSQRNAVKESTYAHYSYTLHKYLLPVLSKVPVVSLEESFLEQAMQQIIAPADAAHKPPGNSNPEAAAYDAEKAARKSQQFYMVSIWQRVQTHRATMLSEKYQGISETGGCPASTPARTASYFCYHLSASGVRCKDPQRIVGTRKCKHYLAALCAL